MLITSTPIDLQSIVSQDPDPSCGGTALFVGTVRNHHAGKKVTKLFYDCYVPLAEKEMRRILETVKQDCRVNHLLALHRVGMLAIGDIAVVVRASSDHREEAFKGCRAVIEQIKHSVPVWKKEFYEDGTSAWTGCSQSTRATLYRLSGPQT